MRTLVTGGAGFIGSWLVESLLSDGHEVVVLDDLSTGLAENLADVRAHAGLRVLIGDVRDADLVQRAAAGCGAVLHLAAGVGVQRVAERPVQTLETNVVGTCHVLAAARESGARVILASTSEVYGQRSDAPFRESDPLSLDPVHHPREAYALSKLMDETVALAHHREAGLRVTVLRHFNTVGPRQRASFGMVLPRFLEAARRGEPLVIYGDGLQTRCFLHVADAVRAWRAVLAEDRTQGCVINLGNPQEITILDLAHRVLAHTGSPSKVLHQPFEQSFGPDFSDLRRRVPCTERLHDLTGWRPQRSLRAILTDLAPEGAARSPADLAALRSRSS